MHEKTIGYFLLAVGLILMVGGLIQILLVFTGKAEPIAVFTISAPTFSPASLLPTLPGGISLPQTNQQKIELIPTDAFNKILNMSTNLFLMGFVLTFGFKIASLGIMLLRPIQVKLANKIDTPSP